MEKEKELAIDRNRWFWLTKKDWLEWNQGVGGSWHQARPLEAAQNLVEKGRECHFVLSPEFFVYLRIPLEQLDAHTTLSEEAEQTYGLLPGHWRFLSTPEEAVLHVVAIPLSLVGELEALVGTAPDQVHIKFAPLTNERCAGQRKVLPFEGNEVLMEWAPSGMLTTWNLLFGQEQLSDHQALPAELKKWGRHCTWLHWKGELEDVYSKMKGATRWLDKALVAAVGLSLLCWLLFLVKRPELSEAHNRLTTYIARQEDQPTGLKELQDEAEKNWSRLYEIRLFGNQYQTLANAVIMLSNTSPKTMKWQSFDWENNYFDIKAEVDQIDTSLTYFEALKKDPSFTDVQFEKLTSKSNKDKYLVQIRGRVK